MRASAKALTGLAAGIGGKAARSAFPKKKAAKARASASAGRRGTASKKAGTTNYNRKNQAYLLNKSSAKKGSGRVAGLIAKYPQILTQRFPLCQPYDFTNIGTTNLPQGTITTQSDRYSTPSTGHRTASIVVLAVQNTEALWNTVPNASLDAVARPPVARTGTQPLGWDGVVPPQPGAIYPLARHGVGNSGGTGDSTRNNFIWHNNAASAGPPAVAGNTDLVGYPSPYFQNGLAENALDQVLPTATTPWVCPSSVLKSVHIDVQVWNPLQRAQTWNIKFVRDKTPVAYRPGSFGEDAPTSMNNIQDIVNSQRFTRPDKYDTIWTSTFSLPGLRAGQQMKKYNVKKSLSFEYIRTQFRRIFAGESMSEIGTQATASVAYSPGMNNACYIVMSSTLDSATYVADVSVVVGTKTDLSNDYQRLPQRVDLHDIQEGLDGAPVGISPTMAGIPSGNVWQPIAAGASFGYSGSVTVQHRVAVITRSTPGAVVGAQQLLSDRIDALESAQALLTQGVADAHDEIDLQHPPTPTGISHFHGDVTDHEHAIVGDATQDGSIVAAADGHSHPLAPVPLHVDSTPLFD